jgi:hypothetical protein
MTHHNALLLVAVAVPPVTKIATVQVVSIKIRDVSLALSVVPANIAFAAVTDV